MRQEVPRAAGRDSRAHARISVDFAARIGRNPDSVPNERGKQ
jgi:hypothetical protein